jgi:2-polyprenyl-3-methyl-5-hydroxy-6-metoxy-1,4-benzoquinol methylase
MEYTVCPLCRSDRHKLLFDRLDHTLYVTNDRFRIVRCLNCSMVFVNPRPGLEEMRMFYPPEFYDVNLPPEKLLVEKQGSLQARAELLAGLARGKLLDIGCGKGEFLFWMRKAGWDVQGLEFSLTAPNVFDMPIYYGQLESAPLKERSFDAITMWAVLEHIHNPIPTLSRLADLLKPGGRAFVLVPNFRSLPARIMRHDDVPRHLLMFTPSTLSKAASAAGLRIRRTVFSDDIFSGSTRGVLNFVIKRAFGETYDEILAQNRSAVRWREFESQLRGKPSELMQWVDSVDKRFTPLLDRVVRTLRCSFTMTAELEVIGRRI